MSTLPASLLNNSNSAAAANIFGDGSRNANARSQVASGSFSEMLRGFDKPPVIDSRPSPADTAPKPAAEPAPQAHANAASADGKTETQRQEAKLKPKQAEPGRDSKKAADSSATQASAPEAAADSAVANTAVAGDDQDCAQAGKPAPADEKAAKAEDTTATAVPPAITPTPTANAALLSLPQGLSAQAKAPDADSELPDEAAGGDIKSKSNGKAGASLPGTARTAARAEAAAAADTTPTAAKAADFASILKDAAQAAPSATRAAAEATARPAGASIDGLLSAAAAQGAATQETRAGDVSAPTVVPLAQPLHEPGFAPEMAARLSMLAADGVQEAQLHLNPADMGPVAVQIVVEGKQAHISFHADQADTRAVLERSLPDLAAALRDSGLTLSGGGVFQQSSGGQPGNPSGGAGNEGSGRRQSSSSARSADDALPALGRAASAINANRTARGVVDLYA